MSKFSIRPWDGKTLNEVVSVFLGADSDYGHVRTSCGKYSCHTSEHLLFEEMKGGEIDLKRWNVFHGPKGMIARRRGDYIEIHLKALGGANRKGLNALLNRLGMHVIKRDGAWRLRDRNGEKRLGASEFQVVQHANVFEALADIEPD